MHELAVTQNLLDLAVRHAESVGATRVTTLRLSIGRLSSIVDDSVQFYWDIISAGTLCAGARLEFARQPAALRCLQCDAVYQFDAEPIPCPHCGSERARIVGGEQFQLTSIDVEIDSPVVASAATADPPAD